MKPVLLVFFLNILVLHTVVNGQQIDSLLVKRIEHTWQLSQNLILKGCCCKKDLDSANRLMTALLTSTFHQSGFPGYSLVGQAGAATFFKILSSVKDNLPLQKKGLQLMHQQVDNKNASVELYAQLSDQLSYQETGKQVYGTIVGIDCIGCTNSQLKPAPIKDSSNVDGRRKQIGLPPLSASLQEMKARIDKQF